MGGKTVAMRNHLERWIIAHPYKKALIFDPKSKKTEKIWFEPNKLLAEKAESLHVH